MIEIIFFSYLFILLIIFLILMKVKQAQLKTLQISKMAALSNTIWQNRKERTNRTTNNRNMVHRPKRYVVCKLGIELVSDTLVGRS